MNRIKNFNPQIDLQNNGLDMDWVKSASDPQTCGLDLD